MVMKQKKQNCKNCEQEHTKSMQFKNALSSYLLHIGTHITLGLLFKLG